MEDNLLEKICSSNKLDRDKAVRQLTEAVINNKTDIISTVYGHLEVLVKPDLLWEEKLGYILASKCLVNVKSENVDSLIVLCLDWLENESEPRVKEAVGDLLEILCCRHGAGVFDKCREKVMSLITGHLSRPMDPDKDVASEIGPGGVQGRLMDRREWKNLAAWKDLELTLGCLGKMFQGLGFPQAESKLDDEVLQLIFKCTKHENR